MRCSHCQELLHDDEERFYIGHWPRGQRKTQVKNYHPECFREFAGEEYANEVMGYTEVDGDDDDTHHTGPAGIRWRYVAWKE